MYMSISSNLSIAFGALNQSIGIFIIGLQLLNWQVSLPYHIDLFAKSLFPPSYKEHYLEL